MKVKILKEMSLGKDTFKEGATVDIETDSEGVPHKQFWRRRVRDSEADSCLEIVGQSKAEPKPEPKTESKKGEKA